MCLPIINPRFRGLNQKKWCAFLEIQDCFACLPGHKNKLINRKWSSKKYIQNKTTQRIFRSLSPHLLNFWGLNFRDQYQASAWTPCSPLLNGPKHAWNIYQTPLGSVDKEGQSTKGGYHNQGKLFRFKKGLEDVIKLIVTFWNNCSIFETRIKIDKALTFPAPTSPWGSTRGGLIKIPKLHLAFEFLVWIWKKTSKDQKYRVEIKKNSWKFSSFDTRSSVGLEFVPESYSQKPKFWNVIQAMVDDGIQGLQATQTPSTRGETNLTSVWWFSSPMLPRWSNNFRLLGISLSGYWKQSQVRNTLSTCRRCHGAAALTDRGPGTVCFLGKREKTSKNGRLPQSGYSDDAGPQIQRPSKSWHVPCTKSLYCVLLGDFDKLVEKATRGIDLS